jgi:microcystin-dependent protein
VPQLFCADGNIKIRLTDKNGAQKLVQDNLLVVGPSGGGGGGGTVDPTTIFQTGAFMQFYGTGSLTGWVRCNGKTIGSATSGANERANADVQALFQYLWGADGNLVVSGGRGASAAADWAANKTIALPDLRGRTIAGLDDMGNTAAGRLTATYFGGSGTTLGASGGAESHLLSLAEMPSHFHGVGISDPGHSHSYSFYGGSVRQDGTQALTVQSALVSGTTGVSLTGVRTISGNGLDTTDSRGSNAPHAVVQPTILATTFIKL